VKCDKNGMSCKNMKKLIRPYINSYIMQKVFLKKGTSIRENYQPITGEGLESENFSWSAGHYLLLLLNE
jgi:hypothetical protein|tara:strand:+ start:1131 stop:1337 length:207 start_codon:yes stop_codon:yes gene_type:complete